LNPDERKMVDRRNGCLTAPGQLSIIDEVLRILNLGEEAVIRLQRAIDMIINDSKTADTGILWRYESLSGHLMVQAVSGVDARILKPVRITSTKGIIGRSFQSGKCSFSLPGREKSLPREVIENIFGEYIQDLHCPVSIACSPLIRNKAKYGVLTFLFPAGAHRFVQNDTLFFRIIADLLAMTMEKADLVKELTASKISEDINRYKAALIPTLAHEMRTPLVSIKGYSTALLMEEAFFSPERKREFLEIIDRESDTLEGLISDYLESSVIDAGKLTLNLQPVRLPRMAAKAAEEIRHRFPRHCLVVDFPTEFPLIDADPERLQQVLRQLLDNAAKYSPEGGMIVLHGKLDGEKVVISVADEGIGIAPEDLNHLFDRFFRVKSHSENQITGTGLGLPISRAIVEAHGGSIWAQSQPRQGSIFYFCLPVKKGLAAAE